MAEGSRVQRLGTLALLYFVQGAPYGFQTACLPLILRKQGVSYSRLGVLKMLFIPWVCKPFYAPIVERTRSDLWWLVTCMVALGCTCLLAAAAPEDSLGLLSVILLALNLASATQDITVDSFAIRILSESELGMGNTIQVVAYKLGGVLMGGSLLWFREELGTVWMWVLFALLYFLAVLLVLSLNLVPHRRENNERNGDKKSDSPANGLFSLVTENLSQITKVPGTWWMVLFLLSYKLCERGESVFPLFLVDKNISLKRMAFWNGIVRSIASISGSTYGGYLLSRPAATAGGVRWWRPSSPRHCLALFAVLRVFPILGQLGIISAWGVEGKVLESDLEVWSTSSILFYLSVLSLCLANFCAGALTTAAFTSMMNLSQTAPPTIQSTHYSLLATTEVLGKLAFATVSGGLIDTLGLPAMYTLFSILALLTLPLIHHLPSTERQRVE